MSLATGRIETAPGGARTPARGLTHHLREQDGGLAMEATRATCSIDDCTSPAHARGWCTKHYQRWKRHGDPTRSLVEERPSGCTIDGCERPVHGLGLCAAHWTRQHRHGHPLGGGDDRPVDPVA